MIPTGADVTQAVAASLPDINPELGQATPERIYKKAAGVVAAVLLGLISIGLLVGGAVVAWRLTKDAIALKQPITLGLMSGLLLPLLPGFVVGIWATLRLDPDAGNAWTQFASVVGAMRKAVKP